MKGDITLFILPSKEISLLHRGAPSLSKLFAIQTSWKRWSGTKSVNTWASKTYWNVRVRGELFPYTQPRNKIVNMGGNVRMFVSRKSKIIRKIFIKIERREIKSLRKKIGG